MEGISCLKAQMMNAGCTCISADLSWFDGVTHIKGNILIQCLLQFYHEDIICYFNFYKTLYREGEKKKNPMITHAAEFVYYQHLCKQRNRLWTGPFTATGLRCFLSANVHNQQANTLLSNAVSLTSNLEFHMTSEVQCVSDMAGFSHLVFYIRNLLIFNIWGCGSNFLLLLLHLFIHEYFTVICTNWQESTILKFRILQTGLLPDKLKMPREATFLKSFIVSQYHTWIV